MCRGIFTGVRRLRAMGLSEQEIADVLVELSQIYVASPAEMAMDTEMSNLPPDISREQAVCEADGHDLPTAMEIDAAYDECKLDSHPSFPFLTWCDVEALRMVSWQQDRLISDREKPAED